jgi:CRISPR/Cas system-associated endonuclease Cas1
MLSFVYALLRHDIESALETVGLDPAVGFLHTDLGGPAPLTRWKSYALRWPTAWSSP